MREFFKDIWSDFLYLGVIALFMLPHSAPQYAAVVVSWFALKAFWLAVRDFYKNRTRGRRGSSFDEDPN